MDKNSEGLIQKTRIQVTDKPGKAKSQEQLLHKTQHLKLNKHELHKKTRGEPRCFGRVSSSCSIYGTQTCILVHIKKSVILFYPSDISWSVKETELLVALHIEDDQKFCLNKTHK